MSRWFRMYDELLDNPKVQRLSGDEFKAWVNILCLASRADGVVPNIQDVAFALRLDEKKTAKIVGSLVASGLLDAGADDTFHPHKWNDRQYKSDVSTTRVKRFRERSKERHETATETAPDTEADTEQSSVTNVTGGEPPSADPDKQFWDGAKAYLGKSKAPCIGKWLKDHTRDRVAAAIAQAQVERAVDPVPYVEAILRKPMLRAVGDDGW